MSVEFEWEIGPGPRPHNNSRLTRTLYAPDNPNQPSQSNGKDVEAIKRMVSRAGFWDWQSFDRTYTDAFAHGATGPTGSGPGVDGLREAIGIGDGSGTFNERCYHALIYARIPEQDWRGNRKEHAGEWVVDATSEQLLTEYQKAWDADHPDPKPPPEPSGDRRQVAMDHLYKRLGYTEQPANSNCDNRSNGIRVAQTHTAGGGTWLLYQPWCGCWAYYALESAGVKGIDSHMASVAQIEDFAKQGAKCYKGWTTDRSRARKGDLAIIGGYGQHVETVRGKLQADGGLPTYGGNTSAGSSGSQSNGGGAYARVRYSGEVRGIALVRYPGE
jgi:hypothetical protein